MKATLTIEDNEDGETCSLSWSFDPPLSDDDERKPETVAENTAWAIQAYLRAVSHIYQPYDASRLN